MKILTSPKSTNFVGLSDDIMECAQGEIVIPRFYEDGYYDGYLYGVSTNKPTNVVTVLEIDISYSFYFEIIIDSISKNYDCDIVDTDNYKLMKYKGAEFNINVIVTNMLSFAFNNKVGELLRTFPNLRNLESNSFYLDAINFPRDLD